MLPSHRTNLPPSCWQSSADDRGVFFSLSRVWGREALLPLAIELGKLRQLVHGTWGLFGLTPSAAHKQPPWGTRRRRRRGWISALWVTRACVRRSRTVPFQLTVHSEMVMAAPSARGMLLSGDLQHQEGLSGHWETGEDRVTGPSPVAVGTSNSFPACSDIHWAHSTPSLLPAAWEPPPAPRELPGSGGNLGCGCILHAGPLLDALGDCRSNQHSFPWASLANSWLLGVHSDHHKLQAFICFLVPVHPGEKLHPLICPSMGDATKTCLCIPVGPSSHAGSSICEASQVWRGLWGELATEKTRCNPSAPLPAAQEHQRQHLSHRESTSLAEHIRRCVKGAGDTFK